MTASNPYNAEFFERYLNDEVTPQERKDFDDQLVNDPELLEYFTLFMDIDEAIYQPDVISLRQDLQNIYDTNAHEWLEEAPMMVEETHDQEIDAAISELDVMALRSTLNDLHDLHIDELNSNEHRPAPIPIPVEELAAVDVFQEPENQDIDLLGAEIDEAIMEDDIMDLRNQLQTIGKEYMPAAKTRSLRSNFSRIASIAAIFLFMIMGGTFWLTNDLQSMSAEKAFDNTFVPMEGKAATRGGDTQLNVDFTANSEEQIEAEIMNYTNKAYERYREDDLAGALVFFEAAAQKANYTNMDVLTFAGICLLSENRADEALNYFDMVIKDKDNTYVPDAQWYTVMAHLRNDDKDSAISLLHDLEGIPEHEHKDDIKKLLKKLE